jgi:hypothetical protein
MWWDIIKRDTDEILLDAIYLLQSGIFRNKIEYWENQFKEFPLKETMMKIVSALQGSSEYKQGIPEFGMMVIEYEKLLGELSDLALGSQGETVPPQVESGEAGQVDPNYTLMGEANEDAPFSDRYREKYT